MFTIPDTNEYSLSGAMIQDVIDAALETLEWTAVTFDDPEYPDGIELDGSCFADAEWSDEARTSVRQDVEGFLDTAEEGLLSGLDTTQVGHDFVLTAQGHGTGFWDRGLGERGERLTELSHPYNFEVYVGDDGKLYL